MRGTVIVAIGEASSYGLSFVRNVLLARFLTKADFGIAASCAMVLVLVQIHEKMGVSRVVVQDRGRDLARLVATCQTVQLLAGITGSLILYVLARPLAGVFGIAQSPEVFRLLAPLPLLFSIGHLDQFRMERELHYLPSTLVRSVPQVGALLLLGLAVSHYRDYRAVIALMYVVAVVQVVITFVVAKEPYRLGFDRAIGTYILRFSWPLVVNGFLIWTVFQGDRFIVASFYTMAELGDYAAAASVALVPGLMLAQVASSVSLPILAKQQDDRARFESSYRFLVGCLCCVSTAFAVGVIVSAESVMRLCFGAKYAGTGMILMLLGVCCAIRILRVAPAVASLATGDTQNQMFSNLWRSSALAGCLVVALMGLPLWAVAACGLIGELSAGWVSFRRVGRRQGLTLGFGFRSMLLGASCAALTGAAVAWVFHPQGGLLDLGVAIVLSGGTIALFMALYPDIRVAVFSAIGVGSRATRVSTHQVDP